MPSLTFDVKQQNKLAKKMVKLYSIAIISYTLSTYFIFILSVKSIECKEKQTLEKYLMQREIIESDTFENIWNRSAL